MGKPVSSPPTKEDSRLLKRSAFLGAVLGCLAVMRNRNNKLAAAVKGALVGGAAGTLIGLVFGEQLKGTVFNSELPFRGDPTFSDSTKARASESAAKPPEYSL